MNWFLIPLTATPQTFQIALNGSNYLLSVYWNNSQDAGWMIDIADADTGDSLAAGLPLITGADLLAGLEYLGIAGQMFVYTNGDANAVPTYENLGTDCNLYFVTETN